MSHARKRSYAEYGDDAAHQTLSTASSLGATLAALRRPDLPTFNLTATRDQGTPGRDEANNHNSEEDDSEWQMVKSARQKRQKVPTRDSVNYPTITYSPNSRLQSKIKISDLQELVLYLLADGVAPQWVSVRHHKFVRKVVVLMVPGLERGMFDGQIPLGNTEQSMEDKSEEEIQEKETRDANGQISAAACSSTSTQKVDKPPVNTTLSGSDDFRPVDLSKEELPEPLIPLAGVFPQIWPVKTPGDDRYHRIHSPLHAMLSAPLPLSRADKKDKQRKGPKPNDGKDWENHRTPVTSYLASVEELRDSDYTLHPALLQTAEEKAAEQASRLAEGKSTDHGWVDTHVEKLEDGEVAVEDIQMGSVTAGRQVLAMDCEMCKTEGDHSELTRIALVSWDGEVVLDELVKPERPIIDYLTPYSGITKSMLEPVTTTLADIQRRLLDIITPETILVGHSLNSDLDALKLTHPFIIDTTVIYPHPRGPPLKSSLKWLAQKYLNREIQKGHGSSGHDSVEDALAVLDLLKQKCEKGPAWGTSEASAESIFKRLSRAPRPSKLPGGGNPEEGRPGAIVDWGQPERSFSNLAKVCISCTNDAEVVDGIKLAVNGDPEGKILSHGGVDFVWARLRELEALRGWWNGNRKATDADSAAKAAQHAATGTVTGAEPSPDAVAAAVERTVKHISDIYEALPSCTAFIVYSGTGDPREVTRLQALLQQFKKEYKTKKWDELSVKWTDTEEQALRNAARKARDGIGFVVMK